MTSLLNLFVFIFLLVNIPAQAKLMSEYTEKTGKLTLLESRKKEFEEARNSKLKAIKHSKDENEQKKLWLKNDQLLKVEDYDLEHQAPASEVELKNVKIDEKEASEIKKALSEKKQLEKEDSEFKDLD